MKNLEDLNVKVQVILKDKEKRLKLYNEFLNTYGDKVLITQIAKKNHLSLDEFLDFILFHIEKTKSRSKTALIFDQLLELEDKKSIINLLVQEKLKYEYLKFSLQEYVLIYRPDLLFDKDCIKSLKEKLKLFNEYVIEENKYNQYSTSNSYSKQIFQVFLNFPFTLKRFCQQYGISMLNIKNQLNQLKKCDLDFYNQVIENHNLKEKIKENNITNDIYQLLNKINELGNDFSILDFYEATIYTADEILLYCANILQNDEIRLLRYHISKYKTANIKILSSRDIEKLLNEDYVVNVDDNLIKVTTDVKVQIIKYLEEHEIPICMHTYKDAIIKYYKEILFKKSVK